MNRYLFILGRKADLAFAELQTVLHRISKLQPAIIKKFNETVIVETDSTLDGQELMRSLGGTVKIVRLGEPVNSQQFLDYLVNILRNETIGKGKIVFGLSIVGSRDPRQIRLIPRTLKDKLDKEGIPSRYVLPKQGNELTSAQIVLGKVTELYLFSHDHILDIGKTIAAQDFEGGGELGVGGDRLGPGVADVEEGSGGCGVLPVVGEAVAGDGDEGEHFEEGAVVEDGLDDALEEDVVGEFLCFGEV